MDPITIFFFFAAFIIGITVHESAHAWVAHKLGDDTAKDLGRISLNPLRHIDPIGTLLLPLLGMISPSHTFFGWAKPTPFTPHNLKEPHKDSVLIALAGPTSNFALALVFVALFYILLFGLKGTAAFTPELLHAIKPFLLFLARLDMFFYFAVVENLILGFFNLIPIPPLDGSSILKILLPKKFAQQLAFFNQNGFMMLILVYNTPLGDLLGTYVNTCVDYCLRIVGLT